ncbi:peptidoglycan-binding protein [Ferrovibrio sp.]|uniref:peptidoglycan-binding protein n=1 Tax=Ferrovibrio sp. TaxID=1917215 RepID=UPI003517CA35
MSAPAIALPPPVFPGITLAEGAGRDEAARALVRQVQQRLNALGCGPVAEDGLFGPRTAAAVRLFQARFSDGDGQPLNSDGAVGPLTWQALFGSDAAPRPRVPPPAAAAKPGDALVAAALAIAGGLVGVREQPPGSNRGPEVDRYLENVGLDPATGSYPWCAAFVYWCFTQASAAQGVANPAIRTAGVLDHWRRARLRGIRCIAAADAIAAPGLVRPGQLFLLSTGGGTGHIGFVEAVANGKLVTIEGNSNDGGAREGIGVFRRDQRRIGQISLGFIDYATGMEV